MADRDIADELRFPRRVQAFEVVMLKDGVNELLADSEDFQRIPIEATDPLAAQFAALEHPKAKGYRFVASAVPGVMVASEIEARRRKLEGKPIDKSKI